MTVGRSKALARWIPWFFGVALLVAVVMFAAHHSQEMAFAQLLLHARPVWLLVALLLQMGTYMTDARIWQQVLGRANISRPLRSYVGLLGGGILTIRTLLDILAIAAGSFILIGR